MTPGDGIWGGAEEDGASGAQMRSASSASANASKSLTHRIVWFPALVDAADLNRLMPGPVTVHALCGTRDRPRASDRAEGTSRCRAVASGGAGALEGPSGDLRRCAFRSRMPSHWRGLPGSLGAFRVLRSGRRRRARLDHGARALWPMPRCFRGRPRRAPPRPARPAGARDSFGSRIRAANAYRSRYVSLAKRCPEARRSLSRQGRARCAGSCIIYPQRDGAQARDRRPYRTRSLRDGGLRPLPFGRKARAVDTACSRRFASRTRPGRACSGSFFPDGDGVARHADRTQRRANCCDRRASQRPSSSRRRHAASRGKSDGAEGRPRIRARSSRVAASSPNGSPKPPLERARHPPISDDKNRCPHGVGLAVI